MANGNVVTFNEYGSGQPISVDTSGVTAVTQLAPADTSLAIDGTDVLVSAVHVKVRGRIDRVIQMIQDAVASFAAVKASIQSSSFASGWTSTLTASGGGALAQVGTWEAHAIKRAAPSTLTDVIFRGAFHFTPAVAGTAETITASLPPTMLPAVNFAAASDASGNANLEGLHAATDFATLVSATVGAKTVQCAVTTAVATDVWIVVSYTF